MSYRLHVQIIDESNDEVVEVDFVTLDHTTIDQDGGEEMVEMTVARMLRHWRNFAREEYERNRDGDLEEESDETTLSRG